MDGSWQYNLKTEVTKSPKDKIKKKKPYALSYVDPNLQWFKYINKGLRE